MESAKPNPPLFWGTLITVVVVDLVTKLIAAATLSPQHIPHEILGNHLRLTLVYNPGAAFGLNLGMYSRWIFMALTAGALFILGRLYRSTRDGDLLRTLAPRGLGWRRHAAALALRQHARRQRRLPRHLLHPRSGRSRRGVV